MSPWASQVSSLLFKSKKVFLWSLRCTLQCTLQELWLMGVQRASSSQLLQGLPQLWAASLLKDMPFPGLPTSKDWLWQEHKGPVFLPNTPLLHLRPILVGRGSLRLLVRVKLFWAWLQFVVFSLYPSLLWPSFFHRCWFPPDNSFVNPASTGTYVRPHSAETLPGSVQWMFFWSRVRSVSNSNEDPISSIAFHIFHYLWIPVNVNELIVSYINV